MRYAPLALALFALTACGGNKEDNQVTETRMDDLDSLEGTISDDMINTDDTTDEAPLEAAPSMEAKSAAKGEDKAAGEPENAEPAKTEDKAAAE
ncbi:MAG: hypothetical protein IBJ12_08645 [Sphingomonadaceae bacterium]|nr:hypothetical protein [Sphingomonadaceae bacterium]